MEKLHFRVLVLDSDKQESRKLERNFLATFELKSEEQKIYNFEDTKFYFVSEQSQLKDIPDIVAFNTVWININFPNWRQLAREFYIENPFCYQVIYGKNLSPDNELLRSRPVGYIATQEYAEETLQEQFDEIFCRDVQCEMKNIAELFSGEKNMLKLKTRFSFYWVPYKNIIYVQSRGRKSYIFINSLSAKDNVSEDDILVKKADGTQELFAYVQNRKLDEIYQTMDHQIFIRIHQSYLVNWSYVQGRTKNKYGWILTVLDKHGRLSQLPVSEKYHDEIEAKLNS